MLPRWEKKASSAAVQKLWGLGLPPRVRGIVWEHSLGNDVGVTHELWEGLLQQITPVQVDTQPLIIHL